MAFIYCRLEGVAIFPAALGVEIGTLLDKQADDGLMALQYC
jgi:hypothetical protein